MRQQFRQALMIGAMILAEGAPSSAANRVAAGSLEQKLKAQYPTGTILVVRKAGIVGVNPECPGLLGANYKDGQLHAPGRVQKALAYASQCTLRDIPVGWKMTVSEIMVIPRSAKISFVVEECDACNGSGAASYRAIVNFQPPDQSLDLGPIQDQITQALAIETSEAGAPSPQPVLGSVYVNSQNPADKLQLNADSSFSLQEGGQAFSGTFAVSGDTLKLHIVQLGKDVDIAIDGKTLIVNGEETWTQP